MEKKVVIILIILLIIVIIAVSYLLLFKGETSTGTSTPTTTTTGTTKPSSTSTSTTTTTGTTKPSSTSTSTSTTTGTTKPSSTSTTTGNSTSASTTTGTSTSTTTEKPINAVCAENDPSNYVFDTIPLKGLDLLQRIRLKFNKIKEYFTLDSDFITNKASLVSTKTYNRGTLKTGVTNIKTPSKYGGTNCTEFPQYVYFPSSADNPLFAEKGLVGLYEVDSFDKTNLLWKDKSGAGNHATVVGNVNVLSVSGNGSTKTFSTLSGTPGTGIIFPTSILPSTYTLFTVARYSGTNKGRIFDGIGSNWLSGFWSNQNKIAHHNGWITNPYNTSNLDWVLSADTNDNYWGNGSRLTTTVGGTSSANLTINQGPYNSAEPSDWQVAYVAVFNRKLTPNERNFVENKLATNFGLTISCPSRQTRDTNGICQCPTNETKDANGECQCIANYSRSSSGVCYPSCTQQNTEMASDGKCVCKSGFELWNGQCKPVCSPNQYREDDGNCYIPCDYQRYMNKTRGPGLYYCEVRCPNWNQFWTGYSCQCNYPYVIDYKGDCIDVGSYYYNPNSSYNELMW